MKPYDLFALSTRVMSGIGWDRELETDIFRATEVNIRTVRPRYTFLTRSLDAVEELRRRLLPQCPIAVGTSADIGWEAAINGHTVHASTEPRARLAALLRAYAIAKESLERHQE
ncbi:hypothetical protein ACN6KF_005685 [Labrys sp. La1]|uniref:hypothetical protein n=1 Tax=Labrys sp. La1 TaxID=3404917 RepID=UPI003EBEEBC9